MSTKTWEEREIERLTRERDALRAQLKAAEAVYVTLLAEHGRQAGCGVLRDGVYLDTELRSLLRSWERAKISSDLNTDNGSSQP